MTIRRCENCKYYRKVSCINGTETDYMCVKYLDATKKATDGCINNDGLNKVCNILNEIFGTPCDYTINNRDVADIINDEDFCESHCSNEDYAECWKRFFNSYKYFKENN